MHLVRHLLAFALVVLTVALSVYIAPRDSAVEAEINSGVLSESGQSKPASSVTDAGSASGWGVAQIDTAFQRALLGYAIARGLNGVISVAQGTELAVQPAGVGLSFTPGEILDPVNDLVERFSWIMMLASSSLGVQRVLLTMSGWWGLALALGVSGVAWVCFGWWRDRRGASKSSPRNATAVIKTSHMAGRVFLFLLVLRFIVPAIAIVNEKVYQTFLAEDYAAASAELEDATTEIGAINDELTSRQEADEDVSVIDRALGIWDRTVARVSLDRRIEEYRSAAENISENTIRLIVVFLMQTVVFPLMFLIIAWGLLKRLVRV